MTIESDVSLTRVAPLEDHILTTKNKVARIIWRCVWLVAYRFTPTPFFGWRCFVLRCFGAKIDKTALPYSSSKIWAPWNLTMHRNSCIAGGVEVYNVAHIELGEDCVISQRSYLCSASHDMDRPGFQLVCGPIIIGAGAWVAAEAFIGPGVKIGKRVVVGARTVLSKSVPDDAIVAGNPAKLIRVRTSKPRS